MCYQRCERCCTKQPVIRRENSKCATSVKITEAPGSSARLEQNAGDQKSGENKEEIYAEVTCKCKASSYTFGKAQVRIWKCKIGVEENYPEYCETSEAIELGEIGSTRCRFFATTLC